MEKLGSIVRVLKSLMAPYQPSSEEACFIRENDKYWKPSPGPAGIVVETALSMPASLLEKFTIAKLIEERTGLSTIVLINSIFGSTSRAFSLAQSFAFVHFAFIWRRYLNPLEILVCLFGALKIIFDHRDGRTLSDLKLNNIQVGDLIYDTLIRYRPQSFTVDRLSIRKHLRLIFRAVFNFRYSLRLMRSGDIKAVVTSHTVYAEFGILCRVAHHFGAVVVLKDMDVFRVYGTSADICEHFLRITSDEFLASAQDPSKQKEADTYFERRLGGQVDQVDLKNAYGNKKLYSKADLIKEYRAAPDKKFIFVLAHAFSDAPHVGGNLLFQDYYIWLKETLVALSRNSEVNVFVKPHPSSYMWGEKGAVETLIDELSISNIFVTPVDFSTLSIRDIADCVVTARGTGGVEYAGFGIPVITCADGFYSGFGIAHEAKSLAAYYEMLAGVASLARLDPVTASHARLILFLTFTKLVRSEIAPARHIFPGDDAAVLIPQQFKEMQNKLLQRKGYDGKFADVVREAIAHEL